MRYSHRFFLYAPVTACVSIIAAVMIYWWVSADALSARLDKLNGQEIAPGVRVSFVNQTVAGFPFRLDTEIDGLKIEIAHRRGPVVWTAEHFASHMLSYDHDKIIMEAAGQQRVSWTADDGTRKTIQLLPGQMRASAITDGRKLVRFDIDAVGLSSGGFAVTRAQFHIRHDPQKDTLDVEASADDLHLPKDEAYVFGHTIAKIRVDGQIAPAHLFDVAMAGNGDWQSALNAWVAQEGAIAFDQLDVDWGKVSTSGKGVMTLDAQHRPMGQLHVTFNGFSAVPQAGGRTIAGAMLAYANKTAPGKDSKIVRWHGSLPMMTLSPQAS